MSKILEMSSRSSKDGRRKIKMVLLALHDEGETNLNGIHWKEEYVLKNIESAKGMPICASFIDDEKTYAFDHGFTEVVEVVDENGVMKREPIFADSECCGVIEEAKVEELEINGETKRVLVGYGHLFYQRYKNFCDQLKERMKNSEVKSSIEIMGINGENIVYENGYNADFRIPQDFSFSGTAILQNVQEADPYCSVCEISQKQKLEEEKQVMELKEIKEVIQSTISELNDKASEYETRISELNSQVEERDAQLGEKDATISELNASVEQLKKLLAEMESDRDTFWAERELLEKEIAKAKIKEKLDELDESLAEFNEDEKEIAKEDIEALKETIEACEKKEDLESVTSEINSIKSKICMNIVAEQKKAEKETAISELNSKKETVEVEDIFSEVCSEKTVESVTDEDIDIF